MIITITLNSAGADTGPFDLYSDVDGYTTAFDIAVAKNDLLAGYSTTAPDGTSTVKVLSTGICTNYIFLTVIPYTTTTSTSTSTSTTTSTSTSTSTTTTTTSTTAVPATTTTTTTGEILYAVWWATGNTGSCGDPCGQQKYTAIGLAGNPLTVSYLYNTSELIPNDYYAPGIGTIGFTNESFGNALFTADLAIDGAMSNNAICGD